MNEYVTTILECLVYLAFFPGLPIVSYAIWTLIERWMDKRCDEIDEAREERFRKYRKMFDEMRKG